MNELIIIFGYYTTPGKLLLSILCIVIINFFVFLIIIRPFEWATNRMLYIKQRDSELEEFCEHHKLDVNDFTKSDLDNEFNYQGCRGCLLTAGGIILAILLIILSFVIF